ncbi:hypothetical protein [Methylocaldum sp.]|uniref:hypothetical protein n=1 Tax=Methylocaldum sp. TaxID=1969727 RepID=UPI002D2CB0C9|nr:hypothetical protein [Methylocaldum sp.]HYE38181.1 hypothetical protein [Methylocaldum sp.]
MPNIRNRKRYLPIAQELRKRLEAYGIKTEIKTIAAWGSIYITCEDSRMGQIRIGDHDERDRYGYRWQVRTDLEEIAIDTSKGHRRFFYPPSELAAMAKRMKQYHIRILENAQREEIYDKLQAQG